MNPILKNVAQAAEILALLVCVLFLTPAYLLWYRWEINRVGF